ncbi:hypothetical protein [Dyella sp. C11]|uniref:hypothetical protein n=1 Tax=Dyella sp. C11 TaxID=2126991 RepID=UPI000D65BF16|nr:hypothetical protein [Dyella sp. C11]
MTIRAVLSLLFALVSALVLGMAAGAVWMVPTLYSQHPLPWLALPLGWLLGKAVRHWIRPAGGNAAVLAALAMFIAALYVNMLAAAARIAGLMGMGLVDAIKTAGLGLLLELSRLAGSTTDDIWFVAGMGVAAFVAFRHAAPARQH